MESYVTMGIIIPDGHPDCKFWSRVIRIYAYDDAEALRKCLHGLVTANAKMLTALGSKGATIRNLIIEKEEVLNKCLNQMRHFCTNPDNLKIK